MGSSTSSSNKKPEARVLNECKQVLEFLKSRKLLDYWRINTTGIPLGPSKFRPNDAAGFSDLFILVDALVLFVELKSTHGQQSVSQKEFEKRVTKYGHVYRICKGAEELIALLIEVSPKLQLLLPTRKSNRA